MVTNISRRVFYFCLHSSVPNTQEERKVSKYLVKNACTCTFYKFVLAAMFFLTLKNISVESSDRGGGGWRGKLPFN